MGIIEQLNTEQLKLPLGFIKIVELIFALIAYTAKNGWRFEIQYLCPDGKTNHSYDITSFNLKTQLVQPCNSSLPLTPIFEDSFSGSSGFFGFVAVASIFFVMGMLFIYLFCWALYSGDERVPQLDLAITSVIAIFWFLATFIWWIGANGVESATEKGNVKALVEKNHICMDIGENRCVLSSYQVYATLTVSIFAGFGCLILFASNMWFTNELVPPTSNEPTASYFGLKSSDFD